jgi:hypothetical protein
MKNILLRNQLRKTPQGRVILKSLKLSGAENEILGKGFFKKIGKGLKSAGKITGKITGRVAKVAAGLVGIPPGAIDALARVDPTAHKGIVKSLVNSPAGNKAAEIVTGPGQKLPGFLSNVKPVYLAAGAAGIVGIILLVKGKK